ncbi:hotdog fold thioesterase [Rossellomorea marisflavi]|jgi:1,4-dihydroxy-2-naphthoyl-CoA hydrolase|uniref:Hotdog fold thioesterase n=1 Tax=Rossellomorea marisflavi TaxID=189381 RepID=A0A5D4RPM4_9BACI|nr:hotdog fold thioesterase [Rossellomorea marisflavi]KQU57945.1 esterase [Bacillus sp. Leaf406]MBV6684430.1 hotdog fold thioesterase [Bacillus sp. JRC01]MDR4935745.1 hotdog fold thioesterase [Rossellomorea marisflavi]MDW4527863.1 hotdog fold thioesterase [Rossellomorea marisflavi]TYS52930.1 hotdog fold thioesterase [Rossellomorea marisflavi]
MKLDHTLISALGIEFNTVEKGRIVATMPVNEQTRQPFGFLHGGASVALAETVASVGAVELIDLDKEICFGLEINANHIKAKKDGEVTATATVLHQGRTTMVWDIKITDEADDLICVSRCTMAVVPKKNV